MPAPDSNAPCPCGSGKSYLQCCADSSTAELLRELLAAMPPEMLDNLDDANAFAATFMHQRNNSGLSDFQGLSPNEMSALLHAPFDSPQVVTFADCSRFCSDAPVLRLFLLLAEAAGTDGLKATAKGNFPRDFCQAAAHAYWTPDELDRHTLSRGVKKEDDFRDLHHLRLVAGLAGLLRKYKGRLVLTQKARKLLAAGDAGSLYMELFRAYATRFNWAYLDGYPPFPIVQQSFLYTLYVLQLYGGESRHPRHYADLFLRAFPAVLAAAEPSQWSTPDAQVRHCYTHRVVSNFLPFLGLATVTGEPWHIDPNHCTVLATPLLDELVQFSARG